MRWRTPSGDRDLSVAGVGGRRMMALGASPPSLTRSDGHTTSRAVALQEAQARLKASVPPQPEDGDSPDGEVPR